MYAGRHAFVDVAHAALETRSATVALSDVVYERFEAVESLWLTQLDGLALAILPGIGSGGGRLVSKPINKSSVTIHNAGNGISIRSFKVGVGGVNLAQGCLAEWYEELVDADLGLLEHRVLPGGQLQRVVGRGREFIKACIHGNDYTVALLDMRRD